MTLLETMDHFLLINKNNNNIEYRQSINSEISTDDRDKSLHKKKKQISKDTGISIGDLFWESTQNPL